MSTFHQARITDREHVVTHDDATVVTTQSHVMAIYTAHHVLDTAREKCKVAFTRQRTVAHADGVCATYTTLHRPDWSVCADVVVTSK